MSNPEIAQAILKHFHLRIENHMSQYVAKRLKSAESAPVPVIGGDARTGIPRRQMIPLQSLSQTPEL
jgi:hypothetical protein